MNKKNTFYAPDDSGEWENLGAATKKRFPNGYPPLIIKPEGSYISVEYCGILWTKFIPNKEDMKTEEDEAT